MGTLVRAITGSSLLVEEEGEGRGEYGRVEVSLRQVVRCRGGGLVERLR